MKKLLIILAISFSLVTPTKSAHAIDPKAKAFMVVCTYGAVGGALLGFASLSFGSNPRAIAQGASLGLYAGILFGTYVLTSYNQKRNSSVNDYPEDNSFYPAESDPYYGAPAAPNAQPQQGGGIVPPPEDDGGGFFGSQRVQSINIENYRILNNKKGKLAPPIYINLLNVTF